MDIVNQQRDYARQAVKEMGQHMGVPIEKASDQIDKFMKLTPEDLNNLAKEFGHGQVIDYIGHIARLKGASNG